MTLWFSENSWKELNKVKPQRLVNASELNMNLFLPGNTTAIKNNYVSFIPLFWWPSAFYYWLHYTMCNLIINHYKRFSFLFKHPQAKSYLYWYPEDLAPMKGSHFTKACSSDINYNKYNIFQYKQSFTCDSVSSVQTNKYRGHS